MNKREKILITVIAVLGVIIAAAVLFLLLDKEKLTEENSVPVYFVKNTSGKEFNLVPVRRKFLPEDKKLYIAVCELLKEPSTKEQKKGIFTEIPTGTKLLGIEETEEKIELNLSEDFKSGGGSTTMVIRLEQLIKTVLASEKEKPVYLKIEGEEIVGLGGEGIAVPQPLSEEPAKEN